MSALQVSYDGMQELRDLANQQYLNLADAEGFVSGHAVNNTGGFTGLLAFFKGSYEEAVAAAQEGLGHAVDGAKQVTDAIADTRQQYLDSDRTVEEMHTRLQGQVTDVEYSDAPNGGPPLPETSTNISSVNNLMGDYEFPGGVNPDDAPQWMRPGATPAAPLNFYNELQGLTDQAQNTGQGTQDAQDMDDFIEENS